MAREFINELRRIYEFDSGANSEDDGNKAAEIRRELLRILGRDPKQVRANGDIVEPRIASNGNGHKNAPPGVMIEQVTIKSDRFVIPSQGQQNKGEKKLKRKKEQMS